MEYYRIQNSRVKSTNKTQGENETKKTNPQKVSYFSGTQLKIGSAFIHYS